ncbi:MAG: DEAD/DEAH box helicase [Candidatus Moraniibacteriota bacterium]
MSKPVVRGKRKRSLSPGKKKFMLKKRQGEIKHKKKQGKISFDLARLTRPIVEEETLPPQESPVVHFNDFALDSRLKENLAHRNLTHPTPIQGFTIPALLSGRDVIGIANTGTGKTAAFLLPLLHQTLKNPRHRSLIIAPTRELAEQIERELKLFGRGFRMSSALCIGGTSIQDQVRNLKRQPEFVIGTPGRLLDLIDRQALDIRRFQAVVLDEVDRMLDMGFLKDVKKMLLQVGKPRQLLFFSATMPKTIAELAAQFLHEPLTFTVKHRATSLNIEQDVVRVTKKQSKLEVLHSLLLDPGFQKVIIFGRTKRGVEKLGRELASRGFKAEAIHGDKTQSARSRTIKRFSRDEISILTATDVAARGLDIPDVTHVINYDVPETYDDYVHRIGRTGRGAKKGKALTFVDEKMQGGVE